MFTLIFGVIVGIGLLGFFYYKYKEKTTAIVDASALLINNEITKAKEVLANAHPTPAPVANTVIVEPPFSTPFPGNEAPPRIVTFGNTGGTV
jgi:hypothetical protein